jgi:outer membrane protein assembly factor BamE (lipoprotein component of BamABCDE complex)
MHSGKRNKIFVVLGTLCLLAACTPIMDNRGKEIKLSTLEYVVPKHTTKTDFLKQYGTPSTVAPFDENTWYYVSQKKERTAFLEPEITNSEVLKVVFNKENQTVEKMELYDTRHLQKIDPVGRETATSGNEMTIIEQLIGNVGRFTNSDNAPHRNN